MSHISESNTVEEIESKNNRHMNSQIITITAVPPAAATVIATVNRIYIYIFINKTLESIFFCLRKYSYFFHWSLSFSLSFFVMLLNEWRMKTKWFFLMVWRRYVASMILIYCVRFCCRCCSMLLLFFSLFLFLLEIYVCERNFI